MKIVRSGAIKNIFGIVPDTITDDTDTQGHPLPPPPPPIITSVIK